MKRIFSILLALTLMLALAVPAFAADPNGTWNGETWTPTDGNSQDVTASYATAATPDPGTTYYFTITWTLNETNTLTFTRGTKGYKWNGETMYYVEDSAKDVDDKWEGETGYKVTVTNQSNASVYVKTSAEALYNLKLTSTDLNNRELTTAAVNGGTDIPVGDTSKQGTAQTAEANYTYAAQDGAISPAAEVTTSFKVGTITVQVSKNTIA